MPDIELLIFQSGHRSVLFPNDLAGSGCLGLRRIEQAQSWQLPSQPQADAEQYRSRFLNIEADFCRCQSEHGVVASFSQDHAAK